MKKNYIIRAKRLIQEIHPYIEENNDLELLNMCIMDYNEQKHKHIIFDSGMCRVCLINSNYVIKFDYNKKQVEIHGGCADELQNYKSICKDGFAYLFAKITKYNYHGRDYYIMPRVKNINYELDDDDLFNCLTPKEFLYVSNHFCDLHGGNFGFDKKGNPIIFDYASRF